MEIKIADRLIGPNHPTYFIADIAANHDGDLERAMLLIRLAKEAGADAAKFQNFQAPKIVSDYGFKAMDGGQVSHQATWKKSVFEVYSEASIPLGWTPTLVEECNDVGIHYFTSPYDFESIDAIDPYLPAYKIGSGEIDWIESLELIASKGKPVLIATGASNIGEVQKAVHAILKINKQLVLMQCNTNYTASPDNYDYINLNVLKTYANMFPNVVLGLSDHTHGNATVLGAVTLGARVIERHFTDSNDREGPDHKFAMNPEAWADMVRETRLLERALGSADKTIAANEQDTQVVQRRCLRAARDIKAGEIFTREMIDVLRPATEGAIKPDQILKIIGTRALSDMPLGKELRWTDLGQ
ncbi:MAG: N-acetylneuraminate synthase family protein [Anaerolineales bacterium]|uniref:N-acetylneuraminate synthase family protein n=1 Tax=Candidatus Desulfolinea nitratireducens TaxID=2841698 RepID=A0A8J6NN92_9CHLR|nr:N-acetylneuraminate synthase family protein [Candidatus Desulfolinea nitratireducens]MBL6959524.1 N-acetylneuraminate synthase family protein [Anaerolineales bacterium]